MKRLLILGAGGTAAYNVIKAVRKIKERIYIVGTDCSDYYIHLARDVDNKFVIPRYDKEHYIEKLNEIIKEEEIQFLHAQPDVEVGRISRDREQIRTKVFLPSKKTVALCHNKFRLIQLLNKAGLPSAKTLLIRKEKDLESAFELFGTKIWLRAISGAGGRGSLPVQNLNHASAWVDYWDGWEKFVAEEFLPGRNMAWQGIFKEGELITSLVWERIEYIISHVSPSGITGTPSVARIVEDSRINDIAIEVAFLISKRPNGIFSIDFKENQNGIPCITEINPGRFFTPSLMYLKAGLNLPEIYLKLAYDEPIPKLPKTNACKKKVLWVRGIDMAPIGLIQ